MKQQASNEMPKKEDGSTDWQAPRTCKYCKKPTTFFFTSMNRGACKKNSCIVKAMRDAG